MTTTLRFFAVLLLIGTAVAKDVRITVHLPAPSDDDGIRIVEKPIAQIGNGKLPAEAVKAIADARRENAIHGSAAFPGAGPMILLRVEESNPPGVFLILTYNSGNMVTVYRAKTGKDGVTRASFRAALETVEARSVVAHLIQLLESQAPDTLRERSRFDAMRKQ